MRFLLFLMIFNLLACTQRPIDLGQITSAPIVDKPKPKSPLVDKDETLPEPTFPLSWEKGHPERKAWSDQARVTAGVVLREFDKAKDVSRFCPKYAELGAFNRLQFWAELVSVMAYFESGWKPTTVFKEPAPLNNESVGLLQLSTSDARNYASIPRCKAIATKAGLMDPLKNLDCGIRIMAHWIAKDGAITTPQNRGASIYWSVLREKRKLPDVLAKLKGLVVCR
jgi:hypothetical protein